MKDRAIDGLLKGGYVDWVKEMFPNDIKMILVSSEYDVEDFTLEDCENNEEELWIDMVLRKLDLRLCFSFTVMLITYDTKLINPFMTEAVII